MQELSWNDLSEEDQNLVLFAESFLEKSYSPYSGFAVGAAVLVCDDRFQKFGGANIENISYGLTLCAERSAIAVANSEGKLKDIEKIAVIGKFTKDQTKDSKMRNKSEGILTPCGACRQVISEIAKLSGQDIEIIMSSADKTQIKVAKISELLPIAF